jgi:hypothetical protein
MQRMKPVGWVEQRATHQNGTCFSLGVSAAWREKSFSTNLSRPPEHRDGLRCAAPILPGAGMLDVQSF